MRNNKVREPQFNGDTPEIITKSQASPLRSPQRDSTTVWGVESLPKGYGARRLPHYEWHDQIEPILKQRYKVMGFSPHLWSNDWALLRRTCGPLHPAQVGINEMEATLLHANRAGARVSYVARYKSIWRNLRYLGIVPADHAPDELLPKLRKPRAVPRPITKAEAELLMSSEARLPMREWFTIAILNGLRAGEVSALEGSWLEETIDGFTLRIAGKGGTDITIPAHNEVARIIRSHRTLGRLYTQTPAFLSERANNEMRRLGVNGTFHACRHHHATHLLELSGGNLVLVAELMRHSNLNTTRGYAALAQGQKRRVLDQLFTAERSGLPHVGFATA